MFRRLIAATFALLATLAAVPAFACGGFFCFQQPIDQSAERILYIVEDTPVPAVTLHIQISYVGDDKQFSWVLPLAKAPAQNSDGTYLSVGSDAVFQLLEGATAPIFQLNWQQANNCNYNGNCYAEDAGAGGTGGGGGGPNSGGVTVVLKENVGPYEAVVIQGSSGTEIAKWLNDNQFIQPPSSTPLLDAYAKQGNVFLALKLQQDKSAGDLVPIVVKIAEPSPCLPIRLTQIAAKPDMPIVAWVLHNARAIPKNFLHVTINDAVVDWLGYGANYKTVVSKAVDQGSGHAFTTEYAQKTTKLQDAYVNFANPTWNTAALAKLTDPSAFLQAMFQQGFSGTTIVRNLITKYIPKPAAYAAVTDQEFYNCLQNGGAYPPCDAYAAAVKAQEFDAKAFAADLETLVVKPMTTVQGQFYAPGRYLTRLYTTLSPEEMTKDPIFAYNKELPDVDRLHTAQALPICEGTQTVATKVELTFADKHTLTVDAPKPDYTNCYFGPTGINPQTSDKPLVAGGGQPAKSVEVLDESGAPFAVEPLSGADLVDAILNSAKAGTPSLTDADKKALPPVTWDPYKVSGTTGGADASSGTDGTGGADASGTPVATDSGAVSTSGCTAGTSGQAGGVAALVCAALVLVRRRALVPQRAFRD